MKRRELLGCAAVLLASGCATLPKRSAQLPESAPDRACDHELCRYWKAADQPAPRVEGEFAMGLCSIGLPEGL